MSWWLVCVIKRAPMDVIVWQSIKGPLYICRGMLAEPHENAPRLARETLIQTQPQARYSAGFKGRRPLTHKTPLPLSLAERQRCFIVREIYINKGVKNEKMALGICVVATAADGG